MLRTVIQKENTPAATSLPNHVHLVHKQKYGINVLIYPTLIIRQPETLSFNSYGTGNLYTISLSYVYKSTSSHFVPSR